MVYLPRMELDFISVIDKYSDYEDVFLHLLEKTITHLKLACEPVVSVSIVDNDFIHELNKNYRHIDRPTDVISFAFLDNDAQRAEKLMKKEPVILGDIYISYMKAEEQAQEYGHSIARELRFLFVHGLLHLLGYDHMNEEEEKVMFSLQEEILEGETY